jgi:hypothetical protein
METVIGPYFQDCDTTKMLTITNPFPADSIFQTKLYDSPILTGSTHHKLEKKYGGCIFHWNGILLHITITTHVDLDYAIMRLSGYLAAPNEAICEALDQILRYLYFYHHVPIMYPYRPLRKKTLAMHWDKATREYLAPEYGTSFINSADADHHCDIRDRHSVSSSLHILNSVLVAWKCNNQSMYRLHSTGSEIISLSEGVKTTGNILDLLSSMVYPFRDGTITIEDNQGTIKTGKPSRLYTNTHHLTTQISWLNEQYTMGIVHLMYTKTLLQISYCNNKTLYGRHLQSTIAFIICIRFYPVSDTQHFTSLYLDDCRLLLDYLKYGKSIPITSSGPILTPFIVYVYPSHIFLNSEVQISSHNLVSIFIHARLFNS